MNFDGRLSRSRMSRFALAMMATLLVVVVARPAEDATSVEAVPAAPLPPQAVPRYLSPAESLKLIELPPGYHLELVLSEPQIREPVVTVFDGNGRMYVAEMRSYMQDINGIYEKAPVSRISLHWSSHGDGVYDRHSVFIDHLILPRIILPLRDSVLVQETDSGDIYEYRDTDGDGVADQKKLFFAGQTRKANLEHQTSGLIWSVDNWMYSTYNAVRIRWTPRGVIQEPTGPNGGQWGLTQDNYGKPWFTNAGGELGPLNFQQPIVYGAFKLRDEFSPDFTEVFPLVPIPDVQGGTKRFRPVEKTLNHFTSCAGQDIYRGDRLPADLQGDLLFGEPVGRLIRRAKVEVRDGVTYLRNASEKSEFIRSSDPYFRPVNMTTAPDGTIYITDMYRGIIQEGEWTRPGSYLRGVIEQYSLQDKTGSGRIWRLVHDGYTPGPQPRLLEAKPEQLVDVLTHPNGWWRDTAQKLLILAQDKSVAPALEKMVRSHPDPLARLHALWTLEGLDALTAKLVREKLTDADSHVRVGAIRVSESLLKRGDATLKPTILALFRDSDPNVAVQAMMTAKLLDWPEAAGQIQRIAVSSSLLAVREIGSQLLNPLSAQIPAGYVGAEKIRLERGQQIFMELCFACHGVDGKGAPIEGKEATLGAPLAGSKTVRGHPDAVINALISGVAGPIDGKTYDAQMVPMGANDDEWIAAIASFVRTGFGNLASPVTSAQVAAARTANAKRSEPWTLTELNSRVPQALKNQSEWKFTSNAGKIPEGRNPPKIVQLSFTAGRKQEPGIWLQVELPVEAELTEVHFDCLNAPKNFPRGYEVQLSPDGKSWGAPVAVGKGSGLSVDARFKPTATRWLRVVQTSSTKDVPWTVDHIVLYVAPAAADASGAVK